MADDILIFDEGGNVVTIAADDLGTKKVQRVKMGWGADGVLNDVRGGFELPTLDLNSIAILAQLTTIAASIVAGKSQVAVASSLPAGSALIGQVNVNNMPAAADTTDAIAAAMQVLKVKQGLTDITSKRAFANIAASTTDGSVVAAVTSKRIAVFAVAALAGGTATNLTFNTKPAGAGSAISPLFANGVNGGEILPFNPAGWFVTNTGEGLTVTTGAGSTSGILVSYGEVT